MLKPYYRLEALIRKKYGDEKFETGCQIVAQFVGLGSRDGWDALKVFAMCNCEEPINISVDDLYKFQQLFGLKMPEDFYTNYQK